MLLKLASGSKVSSGQGPVTRKEATLGTSHRGDLIQGVGITAAREMVEGKGTLMSPRDKKFRTQLPSLGLGGKEGRLTRTSETYQSSEERGLRTLRRACGSVAVHPQRSVDAASEMPRGLNSWNQEPQLELHWQEQEKNRGKPLLSSSCFPVSSQCLLLAKPVIKGSQSPA